MIYLYEIQKFLTKLFKIHRKRGSEGINNIDCHLINHSNNSGGLFYNQDSP